MSKEHVKELQTIVGCKLIDGDFGKISLADTKAFMRALGWEEEPPITQPQGYPSDGSPLSVRALRVCLAEAERWGNQRVDRARVAEYFRGCERDIDGDGDEDKSFGDWLAKDYLGGKHYASCAAAQGFAEDQARLPGERLPPWRSGALRLRYDAQHGLRPGQTWISVEDVVRLGAWPHPGALAIYQNITSPTHGHAERVIVADSLGYRSVGANESGGKWVVDEKPIRYTDASRADGSQRLRLLGFVVDVT